MNVVGRDEDHVPFLEAMLDIAFQDRAGPFEDEDFVLEGMAVLGRVAARLDLELPHGEVRRALAPRQSTSGHGSPTSRACRPGPLRRLPDGELSWESSFAKAQNGESRF